MKVRALLCLASIVTVGAMGTGVAGASSAPTEYFTVTQTSFDGPQLINAAGPITATGTDEQIAVHRDVFTFPNGALTVRHEPEKTRETFDGRTCTGTFTESGNYVISHGTGDYKHATGSGRYKVTGIFQGCDQNAPPTSFSLVIQAHGPLVL